jgi:hypothetical protein
MRCIRSTVIKRTESNLRKNDMEEKKNTFVTMILHTIEETCPVFELLDRKKQKTKKLLSLCARTQDKQNCKLVLSFQCYGTYDAYFWYDTKPVSLYSSSEGRPIFILHITCLNHPRTVVIICRMLPLLTFTLAAVFPQSLCVLYVSHNKQQLCP